MAELSVVSIDKHDVVGAGIAAWCAVQPKLRFVAHFDTAAGFLERVPGRTAQVDVVVVEPESANRRPGIGALQRLCAVGHTVVVFSQLHSNELIVRALQAGAISFVTKSEGRQHLLRAVLAAPTHTPYAPPTMAAALAVGTGGRAGLTAREIQTLVTWSQVSSKAAVATRLHLKESTVRTHVERARAKYAAVGRPAPTKSSLLARLIQDGLLGPDDV